ncbi:MAG TPA: hypothetical protein VLJ15_00785, partial [Gammaproteobacteria bacterium]|nr:hypothetical protein [Gammaproteobacteria bacterium]
MNTRETTGTKVKNTLKGWYQKAFPEEKPAAAPLSPLLTANDTIHPNTPQPEQAGQPLLAYLKPDAKNVTVNKYRNLEDECMRELITKLVVEFNFRQMDAISQGKLCFLTTSFCSTSLPMNSLEEHLVDIRTHLTGSVAAFIYMAIFVDLYLARTNDYLHPYNAHRLIFTSFVVAD